MRMEIPLGARLAKDDSLPLVQSATVVVVFADGTHESYVVKGPATGRVSADRQDLAVYAEELDPVSVVNTSGINVTFTFEHAKEVKGGHA